MTAQRTGSRSKNALLLCAAAALIAALPSGCAPPSSADTETTETAMAQTTSPELSPEQFAAAQQELEKVFPRLQQEAAGDFELKVTTLSESSCLRPEVGEQQEQTRWEGILRGAPADAAGADAAVSAIIAALQEQGWTLDRETDFPEEVNGTVREVTLHHGGIHATVTYSRSEVKPEHAVEVLAVTGCIDHPRDHQMLRSPLDPQYGTSSKYYPDGA